jgi:hypothetical protein
LASLTSPESVTELINQLPDEKQRLIHEKLHHILNVEVEVQKTRYEPIPILSTYFSFNSISKPNPAYEKLAQADGNISENLITNNLSSYLGIISLFKFNFPIYPVIERCYEEILTEKQKSFYYLILPIEAKTSGDYKILEDIINTTLRKNIQMFKNTVFIFNLDFIPYLSKPTIILADSEENLLIKSIIKRVFNDSVSLIIDSGLFKNGFLFDYLTRLLPDSKFKVINLVMTYDFLNDYSMLKNFLGEFIK